MARAGTDPQEADSCGRSQTECGNHRSDRTLVVAASPSRSSPPPLPGHCLAGRYVVEGKLGSGGAATVFAAWDLEQGTRVALKVPTHQVLIDPSGVARLAREAQIARRLTTRHVARLLDVACEEGTPILVFEYLDGHDLADVLGAVGTVVFRQAVAYALDACAALGDAHELGIVHRDVKPENLFLTRSADGEPIIKVLDFGIAKCAAPTETALTQTGPGGLLGSPRYMPPEQLRSSAEVDASADVWALGAVLYELIAGRRPFEGRTLADICANVLMTEPIPLGQLVAVPPELEACVHRCLEKNPRARYASARELAYALNEARAAL